MLIKALCDYSALQENKTPAGYCKQAIHFEILLTPDGQDSRNKRFESTPNYPSEK